MVVLENVKEGTRTDKKGIMNRDWNVDRLFLSCILSFFLLLSSFFFFFLSFLTSFFLWLLRVGE